MNRLPRLSPKQKAGAAVALALLMWLPTGISTETLPVVTGHSVFFNGDTFDRCLASIAGILRSRVMWFNDMVLAEQYSSKGTFVYVTENGSADPTQASELYSAGVFYDFVDPNGAHWHVEEAFMLHGEEVDVDRNVGVNGDDPTGDGGVRGGVQWSQNRTYVWIVEVAERPIHDEFAGDPSGPYYHDLYNFLLMVDTCKMKREQTTPYNTTHDLEDLSTERGHPANTNAHEHEVHQVNIWIGTRPLIVPMGASTQSASWQSQWATGYAAGNATQPSTGQTDNGYPCRPDDPLTPTNESGC